MLCNSRLMLHVPWPQVFIKGISGKTSIIEGLRRSDSVRLLMEHVHAKQDVPPEEQRLLYAGKQLQAHLTLGDYGLSRQATIHLVLRLPGGA
jgi:ubiquitin-large subunit ribosomal protein L40e